MHTDEFHIRISIMHKIMLHVILVVFVAVGISTYLAVKAESKVLTEALIHMGKSLAINIASSTESAFWSLNWIFVERQLKGCPQSGRREVVCAKIVKADGEVYMSSDKTYSGRTIDASLLSDKDILIKDYAFQRTGEKGYLVVHPFKIGHDQWYIVLELSLKRVNAATKTVAYQNLRVGCLIVLMAVAGAYFLAKSISKPLISLAGVAKEIGGGSWRLVQLDSKDEVGLLGHSFNRMIHTLKAAEAELRASEEKYRNIFENSTEGIFQTTPNGRILTANPAFAKIKGFDSPEELKKNTTRIGEQFYADPKQREIFKTIVNEKGYIKDFETKICRRDGKIIDVLINARVVYDDKQNPHYYEGILQDVTRKKEVETLKIGKRAAEAKAKAKSSFLANMSHEIRTPLNTILGYSELLKTESDREQRRDYLDNILSNGRLLLAVINDILDFSMIEKGKVELNPLPMSVVTILNDVRKQFTSKIVRKGIRFDVKVDQGLKDRLINFDEIRFRQILINLIDNAYKYTDTGLIRVTAQETAVRNHHIDMIITVQDSGIGISDFDTLFKEFEQLPHATARVSSGSGLGLAIVQRLVQMMNGSISVDSWPGQGSSFQIIFRDIGVVAGENMPIRDDCSTAQIDFKSATVMVVDDNKSNRGLIRDFLRLFSLNVVMAESGKEAIEKANTCTIDIILMDLKMPVMDGFTATHLIKSDKELKTLPVIALTANITEDVKKQIQAQGCDGFLLKPVSKDVLVNELKRFLPYTYNGNCVHDDPGAGQAPLFSKDMLSAVTRTDLVRITDALEKLTVDRWGWINKTMIDREIKEFAQEVETLGKQYNFTFLCNWGANLHKYAKNFNIGKMHRTFEQFPLIIKQLKS